MRLNNTNPFYSRTDWVKCFRCDWRRNCIAVCHTNDDEPLYGRLVFRCRGCKSFVVWSGRSVDVGLSKRLSMAHASGQLIEGGQRCRTCLHPRKLVWAHLFRGLVTVQCRGCKQIGGIERNDSDDRIEACLASSIAAPLKRASEPLTAAAVVPLMEEQWQLTMRQRSLQRAELAVGLRFDVFARDNFRCQYCGRAASDGVVLHADHVIPSSKGGPTVLDNLVTACRDCNLGKSDKDLSAV